jgi:hypothetical protein
VPLVACVPEVSAIVPYAPPYVCDPPCPPFVNDADTPDTPTSNGAPALPPFTYVPLEPVI